MFALTSLVKSVMNNTATFLHSWWVLIFHWVGLLKVHAKNLIGGLLRNSILAVLVVAAYYFGKISEVEAYINTMQYIVAIECLAILMSNVALFFYTTVNFTEHAKSKREMDTATSRVIGFIFLAVHICVGLTVVGIYFTNFQ